MKVKTTLMKLSDRLSAFEFNINRPGPDARPVQLRITHDLKSGKRVFYWANASSTVATLFYNGKPRMIAKKSGCTLESIQAAARIADAACVFFWKYRKRVYTSQPEDGDLNFPIKFAQADLKEEPLLLQTFKEMETEMLSLGYITLPGDDTKEEKQQAQIDSLRIQVAAIQAQLAELTAKFNCTKPLRELPAHLEPQPPTDGTMWNGTI